MVCEEIRGFLSEYVDEVLTGPVRAAVEAHLASCEACRKELESLRSVLRELHSLEPVEPPRDFLAQLHGRMAESPWFVRTLRKLFTPMKVKIPLQFAGALAVACLAFLVLQVPQQFSSYRVRSYSGVPMKQAREAQERETGSGLAGTDSARAPVVAVEPTPGDEKKAETPAPPSAGRTAPSAMKMKDAPLLRSKPERAASLKQDSAVGSDVLEDKAIVELVVRMRKEKAEKAFSPAATGLSREALPQVVARSAEGEALKTHEPKETDPWLRKVRNLIEGAQGKVLSAEFNKDTGKLDSVHAEIPANQYSTLYDRLSALGDVQSPAKVSPREDRALLELRIKMEPPR